MPGQGSALGWDIPLQSPQEGTQETGTNFLRVFFGASESRPFLYGNI